jgi:twinkle protein
MSHYAALLSLDIPLKKHTGQAKVPCPRCSETRKHKNDPCLSVNIDTGAYNCHNPGCGFFGCVATISSPDKKTYVRPAWSNLTALSDGLVKYWSARGISQQTLIRMKITEGSEYMPQSGKPMNTVQFNYFRNGELVNVKYRTGNKHFKMFKDGELIFYNLDGIRGSERAIVVEGEPDCLSFIESGIDAVVSVPNGASKGSQKLEYLDNCWTDFEDKKKIFIATDNDDAGRSLRDELVRRLGDERCYLIDFGDCKDANEYMVKHGKFDLANLIETAKPVPLEGVFTGDQMFAELSDLYAKGLPPGEKIGIPEFDELLTFTHGQLTVITGIPNHGKSDFLDQIISLLSVLVEWRFGIFSPENWPLVLHMSKLSEKLIGKRFGIGQSRMSPNEMKDAAEFIDDHFFWIRSADENDTLDDILLRGRKLVTKYGINALVIDPWNTIEHSIPKGMQGTDYVGSQLAKITTFAKRYMVHVFLVAHPTKMQKDKHTGMYEIPTLYNISGSGNFFNKADNGICVYRDFEKKKTIILVQKVRFKHLGQVGYIDMEYNPANSRYNVQHSIPDLGNHLKEKPYAERARILAKTKVEQEEFNQSNINFSNEHNDMPF